MEFTEEEKQYWSGIISYDSIKDIMEKRQENSSCIHDLARVFNPQGKLRMEIKQFVSSRINQLYKQGKVVYLRRESCKELGKSHLHFRIRLKTDVISRKPKTTKTKKRQKTNAKYNRITGNRNRKIYFEKEIMEYAKKNPKYLMPKAFKEIFNENTINNKSDYLNFSDDHRQLEYEGKLKLNVNKEVGGRGVTEVTHLQNTIKEAKYYSVDKQELPKRILESNMSDADKVTLLKLTWE